MTTAPTRASVGLRSERGRVLGAIMLRSAWRCSCSASGWGTNMTHDVFVATAAAAVLIAVAVAFVPRRAEQLVFDD